MLFLFAASLAGCIARIAFCLLLGFLGGLQCGGLFGLTRKPRRLGSFGLLFETLLLGLGGLALQARLFAAGRDGLTLRSPLHNFGIVGLGLSAEFIQDIPPRILRSLLPIRKTGFLESSHRTSSLRFGAVISVR